MRIECPRCGQAIGGADVDLTSQMAVCRPCGELVSLAAALAAASNAALVPVSPSGALFRPTDLSWREEQPVPGKWQVTIFPPRILAIPAGLLLVVPLMTLLSGSPSAVLFGAFVAYIALLVIVNRTTVALDRNAFAFFHGPIPQGAAVREPIVNVVGFRAIQSPLNSFRGMSQGRWHVYLLTRDLRAIPIRFGFGAQSHAEYAAARLSQMLVDVQQSDAPYRG
jgi:hypothetical protein